jgi:hypothetical protein
MVPDLFSFRLLRRSSLVQNLPDEKSNVRKQAFKTFPTFHPKVKKNILIGFNGRSPGFPPANAFPPYI